MDVDRGEVPEIQGCDGRCPDSLGDRRDNAVNQPEPEIPVSRANLVRPSEIAFGAGIHDIPAFREVPHERQLRFGSDMCCHQIVDFGKDRPGENPVGVPLEEVA